MNYATDTANFGLQHISLCKLLAILIAILHLQGGFSVCSFKDGASVLPMSILREEDYEVEKKPVFFFIYFNNSSSIFDTIHVNILYELRD